MKISKDDFGTLCICAIRYCHGRETYMPELVQRIVGEHLTELTDKDVGVLVNDCDWQNKLDLYGDPSIDKPGWLRWAVKVKDEYERRMKR